MQDLSKYWKIVKLNSQNIRKIEMIVAAKTYFQSSFPGTLEVADTTIQRQLWQQMRRSDQADTDASYSAEICLRCYISHKIYQVCCDLETKFGSRNSFTCEDLLPYVLDDQVVLATQNQQKRPASSYQSLATNVLKTFDPAKGSLTTWVSRYVKQHSELKRFLLQHGVFLVSDWAVLNNTNPKEVQRIFTDMYCSATIEIQQACDLLISYHAVYREDRIEQQLTGGTLPCQPPTPQQLTRIANDLQNRTGRGLSAEIVLKQLSAIASKLRRYRIAAQGGAIDSVSFDQPDVQAIVELHQVTADEEEHNEFMNLYRQEVIESLDQAISQVVDDFIAKIQRKNAAIKEYFITALHLFHCQGQSMSQIAPQVGLKKQYEVSRLLKISELRADIRQKLLLILRDRVLKLAKNFAKSESLQNLDEQIESILDEEISEIFQKAESEVKNPTRNQPLRSLLACRLCYYLNSRNT